MLYYLKYSVHLRRSRTRVLTNIPLAIRGGAPLIHLRCLCTDYFIWRWEILLQYLSFYVVFLYEFKIKHPQQLFIQLLIQKFVMLSCTAVEQMLTEHLVSFCCMWNRVPGIWFACCLLLPHPHTPCSSASTVRK